MITTTQYSALGDLRRFGRMYPPGPRQTCQRGTQQGYSRRTLQALVDAGWAVWSPRIDGTWPSVTPTDYPCWGCGNRRSEVTSKVCQGGLAHDFTTPPEETS